MHSAISPNGTGGMMNRPVRAGMASEGCLPKRKPVKIWGADAPPCMNASLRRNSERQDSPAGDAVTLMRHSHAMRRRSPFLTVVITLLLLVQWGSAFAHCVAKLGTAPGIEICTPDGVRIIHLDAEGQPAEPAQAMHDSCPLCPAGALAAAPSPVLPAVRFAYSVAVMPPIAGMPTAPARAPPVQPRAPPVT